MRRSIRNLFMSGELTFTMMSNWCRSKSNDSLFESEDTAKNLRAMILVAILGILTFILLFTMFYNIVNTDVMGILTALTAIPTGITIMFVISAIRWKKDGFPHLELIHNCETVHGLLLRICHECMYDLTKIEGVDLGQDITLNPIATRSHEEMKKIFHYVLYERTDLIAKNTEEIYRTLGSFGFTEESWEKYVNKPKKSKSV